MDNKQIIIDGVNIKDCKRRIGKDNYCRYYKRLCSENNYNCIWKKYLRKEQECEELKKQVEVIKERLFRKIAPIDYTDCPYYIKMVKLKQTLTYIKKIAEILAPMTDEYENCYDRDRCFECEFTEDCQYFNIKQILQKINEVEINGTNP